MSLMKAPATVKLCEGSLTVLLGISVSDLQRSDGAQAHAAGRGNHEGHGDDGHWKH